MTATTKTETIEASPPDPRGALVVLSGGLDSSTMLFMALEKWPHYQIQALSFGYGQKHEDREAQAAHDITRYAMVDLEYCPISTGVGGLTDEHAPIPDISYKDIKGVSPTYVPFRNGLMIARAVSAAAAANLAEVYFGAHADDASGDAYPDCTLEFIGAMAAAVYRGTYGRVQLKAPLLNMEKWEIVKLGHELGVPFSMTFSCYKGGELHCGVCPTCRARREAFVRAGVSDPTEYEG